MNYFEHWGLLYNRQRWPKSDKAEFALFFKCLFPTHFNIVFEMAFWLVLIRAPLMRHMPTHVWRTKWLAWYLCWDFILDKCVTVLNILNIDIVFRFSVECLTPLTHAMSIVYYRSLRFYIQCVFRLIYLAMRCFGQLCRMNIILDNANANITDDYTHNNIILEV